MSSPPPLPLVRVEGVAVLRPTVDLDHATVPALAPAVLEATRSETSLVVDLTEVGFLDSSALRLLDELARHCGERGGALAVVAPPGGAARFTLRVTGFSEALVVDDAAAAIRALAGR